VFLNDTTNLLDQITEMFPGGVNTIVEKGETWNTNCLTLVGALLSNDFHSLVRTSQVTAVEAVTIKDNTVKRCHVVHKSSIPPCVTHITSKLCRKFQRMRALLVQRQETESTVYPMAGKRKAVSVVGTRSSDTGCRDSSRRFFLSVRKHI
jgi:hypothetical protein